jgi:hypothetical protein
MKKYLYIVAALVFVVGCHKPAPTPTPEPDQLELVDKRYELSYEAQTLELKFDTNAEYSFELSADWIKLEEGSRSQGMKSYTVRFAVEENTSKKERVAYIIILAGEAEQTITIVQGAMPERMTLQLDHSNATLSSPKWRGDAVTGSISWGDGTEQSYAEGVSHSFSGEKQRTIFDMRGATGFKIEHIDNVDNIEIGVEL